MTSVHFLLVSTLLSIVNCESPPITQTHMSASRQSCRLYLKLNLGYHGKGLTCPLLKVPRVFPPAAPTTHLGWFSVSP